MKARCTIQHRADGRWLVRHDGPTLGQVEISDVNREHALKKMRDELQYRIELCPCSGVSGDTVELQVEEIKH